MNAMTPVMIEKVIGLGEIDGWMLVGIIRIAKYPSNAVIIAN